MAKNNFLAGGVLAMLILSGAGCSSKTVPPTQTAALSNEIKTYNTSPVTEKSSQPNYPILSANQILYPSNDAVSGGSEMKGEQISDAASLRSGEYTIGQRNRATSADVYTFEQYSATAQRYKDKGYYIQVSKCQSNITGTLILKHGVRFTIDNRDAAGHLFAFGEKLYAVPGYGFAVPLAEPVGKQNLTCDNRKILIIDVQP